MSLAGEGGSMASCYYASGSRTIVSQSPNHLISRCLRSASFVGTRSSFFSWAALNASFTNQMCSLDRLTSFVNRLSNRLSVKTNHLFAIGGHASDFECSLRTYLQHQIQTSAHRWCYFDALTYHRVKCRMCGSTFTNKAGATLIGLVTTGAIC